MLDSDQLLLYDEIVIINWPSYNQNNIYIYMYVYVYV